MIDPQQHLVPNLFSPEIKQEANRVGFGRAQNALTVRRKRPPEEIEVILPRVRTRRLEPGQILFGKRALPRPPQAGGHPAAAISTSAAVITTRFFATNSPSAVTPAVPPR